MSESLKQKIKNHLTGNLCLAVFLFLQTAFPLLYMYNASNTDVGTRISVNCLYFAVTFVCFFLTNGKPRNILLVIFYLLSIVPNCIVLGFFDMDNSILKSTDFWVVFDTNTAETKGFLSLVPTSIIVKAAVYATISLLILIITIRKETCIKKDKSSTLTASIAIFIWSGISLCIPFRTNVPYIEFYKSWQKYNKISEELTEFYDSRKNIKTDASCYLPDVPKTFVVVIGESATKSHYGLYGYPRNTTPHLDSIKDELLIYQDVTTPFTTTLNALRYILTFSNHENPDAYKKDASIIEIIKAAGYKTFWLDNNQIIDCYEEKSLVYSYHPIVKMCNEVYFNNQYLQDETLIPLFEKALQDTASNKVIFLHLNGSHMPYEIRYPQKYEHFRTKSDLPSKFLSEMNEKEIETANAYDNSILYNDYIISEFIRLLRSSQGLSSLLYFSDHGEEVFDSRHLSGRSLNHLTQSLCRIPFFVWRNEEYLNLNNLSIDVERAYSSEDVIHSMMDMFGISYELKDTCRSIFSDQFKQKKRMVNDRVFDESVK